MRTLSITSQHQQTNGPRRTDGAWGRVRRAAAEIAPESVERIAQRVVQLLRHEQQTGPDAGERQTPAGLLTVSQLARHLGLNRAWVYEHADGLGAIRIGDGPKARIRFDLDTARAALRRNQASRTPAPAPAPASIKPRRKRARPAPYPADAPLLEIRDPYARGIRTSFARPRRRGRIGAI